MTRPVIMILLFALCACGIVDTPTFALCGAPGVLYISAAGKDTNPGTLRSPMRTLNAACVKLKIEAPDCDAQVRCLSTHGIYYDQFVTWDYWNPRHTTTIKSWPPGTRARFEMRPAAACPSPFFTLRAAAGEPTNLRIENLIMVNYNGGAILFLGTWPNETPVKWNGYNRISNCIFGQIGNLNRPSSLFCDGVINCVRSVCDTIESCIFYRCANNGWTGSPINGIYLKHGSRGNVIRNNQFRGLDGNSIKLRNGANANVIESNTFIRSGNDADVISWYCDENLWDQPWSCSDPGGFSIEGPSDSTLIRGNLARGNSGCGPAILWADLMLNLPPCGKCNPCRGLPSTVTLSGNTCDACLVSDWYSNDVLPY